MPLDCKIVNTAANDVIVFTVTNDEKRIAQLRHNGIRVEALSADPERPGDSSPSVDQHPGRVPLGKVLDHLGREGILNLMTETGTRLNTALLDAGLVDRVLLFVSPQVMGSDAVPAFGSVHQSIRMADIDVERYGNDLGLSSLLRDPWPAT